MEKLLPSCAAPDPSTWQLHEFKLVRDHLTHQEAMHKVEKMKRNRGLPSSGDNNAEELRRLVQSTDESK